MSVDPPPWATPRDHAEPPVVRRPGHTESSADGRPPGTSGPLPRTSSRLPGKSGPPPGPRPPGAAEAVDPDPESRAPEIDPHTGVIAGPIQITRPDLLRKPPPDLLAVAVAALSSVVALAGRALFADVGIGALITGLLLPTVVAGAYVVARCRGAEWAFTIRAPHGVSIPAMIRTDAPRDALRPGDLVHLVPDRPASGGSMSGRHVRVRVVEVPATLNGPVIRRLSASTPPPWTGYGIAIALLASGATTVL